MEKWGEVIEKFSPQEQLSQSSSDLNESFFTWYRFNLAQIMVPERLGGTTIELDTIKVETVQYHTNTFEMIRYLLMILSFTMNN
jgi:hypothetical protein